MNYTAVYPERSRRNGDGNRVQKSSGTIYWYGAGTEILDESDASGNFTNEYVFGVYPERSRRGGKRIALRNVSSGTIYYYEEDMLGSSRTIVQAGQTSLCYDADFYPFGGERVITNTCAQHYKFEGKERDTETGNDDFGARYYASRLGRWLSADWSAVPAPVPYANLSNPQTLNLYAMVSDNPETFADLDGHWCLWGLGTTCGSSGSPAPPKNPQTGEGPAPTTGTGTPPSTTQQAQANQQSNQQNQNQKQSGATRTPGTGEPNSTVKLPNGTERTYGPDGRAVKDIDPGHPHNPDPHAHDWDWNKKHPRQPARPLTPEEKARVNDAAKAVGEVTVGAIIIGTLIEIAKGAVITVIIF